MALTRVTTSSGCIPFYRSSCTNTRVTSPAMAITRVTTSCVCIPFYRSSCTNTRVTSPAMALTRVTTSRVCIPLYRSSCANTRVTSPAMALTRVTTSCVCICIPFYRSSCANTRVTNLAMALTRVTTSCVCIPFYRSSCANTRVTSPAMALTRVTTSCVCTLHTIVPVQLCQHPSHQSSNGFNPGHNQLCLHTIVPVQLCRHIISPVMAVPHGYHQLCLNTPSSCASAWITSQIVTDGPAWVTTLCACTVHTLPLAQLNCRQNHRFCLHTLSPVQWRLHLNLHDPSQSFCYLTAIANPFVAEYPAVDQSSSKVHIWLGRDHKPCGG
jgi:hypothetical protein